MVIKALFHTLFLILTVLTINPVLAEISILVKNQDQLVLKDVVIEMSTSSHAVEDTTEIAVMDQINKAFVPSLLVIHKGQTVDFPNSDNIRHHVYSFSQAKIFELKLYADKPESPVSFEQHGVVVLGCNIHDSMLGYIYIANSAQVYITDESGQAILPDLSAASELSLWHAQQQQGPEFLQRIDLSALDTDQNGNHIVTINTVPPQPRNSFEDVFGGTN